MILYYDIYIDDTPLYALGVKANQGIRSTCSQYKMPRKLDIAKYTLASYAMVSWSHVIIKFDAKRKEDAISFLEYSKRLFPTADISSPCSSDYLSYKKTVEKICELGDNWIFYAPNNDHPLVASELGHLYEAIKKASVFSTKYEFVSIAYSHLSEFINAPMHGSPTYLLWTHNSEIIENDRATISYVLSDGNNSSCQIVNKNLLSYWFCSHDLGKAKIIRAEDVRKFFLTKNQLIIVPKNELCSHFDGYSHLMGTLSEILPNQIPPLFIPNGFFENNIKIRYGYELYKNNWVNINPSAEHYSFVDDEYGTDLKICLEDLPLFWRNRISEIDINPDINLKQIKRDRDRHYKILNNPWSIASRKLNIGTLKYKLRYYKFRLLRMIGKIKLSFYQPTQTKI